MRTPAVLLAGAVVVELFTSQGCSSCPGADRLLSTWGAAAFARGDVLPLSYDVDYWDYLGWKDVFSAPAHTRRQREYAAALGTRTYTPQLVVAGREAFVGSDEGKARAAVEKARAQPGGKVSVTALKSPAGRLRLKVSAAPSDGTPHAMLAIFENGLVTAVRSGENAGESLRNDFVVRRLVDLGPAPLSRSIDEAWDPAWDRRKSGAAVFLQDAETKAIDGAAWSYPIEGS